MERITIEFGKYVRTNTEKVLDISASQYINSVGKKLSDYEQREVCTSDLTRSKLVCKVPEGTEAVAEYRHEPDPFAVGIALIQKKGEKK